MPSVSHSRADGYLLCRRKDYYGYTLGLQRISESESLAFGSAVHKVLEVFYSYILKAGGGGKTPAVLKKQRGAFGKAALAALDYVKELYSSGEYEDGERFPNLKRTMERYFEEAEPFVKQGWRILAVEKEFLLEYDPDTESRFRFVIDLILEDPKGFYVIVDHKTAYDFYSDEALGIQGQIPKYIGALRGLNYRVSYGIYNQIRTRPLAGTKMLKADLVEALRSHAANALGEDDPDVEAHFNLAGPIEKMKVADLEELAVSVGIKTRTEPEVEMLFQTIEFKPSAARVVRTFEEQIAVAAEITAREALPVEDIEKSAYRTANKMVCQSCSFKDLCEAELAGQPTKLLLETEFKVREKRPMIEVSEDAE